jgi:DNA-binding NarL/FixJ family response regulator
MRHPNRTRESGQDNSPSGSILIIDDQPIYRNGLKHVILENLICQKVLETESFSTAGLEVIREPELKLIIATPGAHRRDMRAMIEDIRALDDKVPYAILSEHFTRDEMITLIDLGASGLIVRSAKEPEIVRALHAINNGAIYICSSLSSQTGNSNSNRRPDQSTTDQTNAIGKLTRRQLQVLAELGHAKPNKIIGEALNISENTVKIHVAAILRTLDVENRTQAALLAQSLSQN